MKRAKEINLGVKDEKQLIFTVVPYSTSYGLSILSEIFLLFGESLVHLALGAKDAKDAKSFMDAEIKPEQISAMMMGLTSKVNPDTLDTLFKKILINTNIDKGSESVVTNYEEYFAGEYELLFKLVWKTLGAQYGDFLGKLGALKKLAVAKPQ